MADEFEAAIEDSLEVDVKFPNLLDIISVEIRFYDQQNKEILVKDEIRRLLDEHDCRNMHLRDLIVKVVTSKGDEIDVDLNSSIVDCADDFTNACIRIQTI